jgi:hypothetical protein
MKPARRRRPTISEELRNINSKAENIIESRETVKHQHEAEDYPVVRNCKTSQHGAEDHTVLGHSNQSRDATTPSLDRLEASAIHHPYVQRTQVQRVRTWVLFREDQAQPTSIIDDQTPLRHVFHLTRQACQDTASSAKIAGAFMFSRGRRVRGASSTIAWMAASQTNRVSSITNHEADVT